MREEKRIALIPAYEPEKEMVKIAKELKEEGFCVVIINDGSSQECDLLFVQASEYATIYTHTHNRGKGAAIKTGLEYIKNNLLGYKTKVIVFLRNEELVNELLNLGYNVYFLKKNKIFKMPDFKDLVDRDYSYCDEIFEKELKRIKILNQKKKVYEFMN